ncbi:MAG TPA: hypothetical protein VK813_04770 [Edaphobacter sp.]|nr:hypothetical protein [Edaphobacter sp.]
MRRFPFLNTLALATTILDKPASSAPVQIPEATATPRRAEE